MIHTFLFLGEPRGLFVIQLAILVWLFFGWRMFKTKRLFIKKRKQMGLRYSFRPFFLPEKKIFSTGFEMYNQLAKERNQSGTQFLVVYIAMVLIVTFTYHRTYPNAGRHNQQYKPPIAQNDTTKAS